MRTRLLLAVLAVTIFSIAATRACAQYLQIPNAERGFRVTWRFMEFPAGGFVVSCPVTFEGTLHSRVIEKVADRLIGYITTAAAGERCTGGGEARFLTENLPWHVRYASFEGTLPRIEGVRIKVIGARAQIRWDGAQTCLFETTDTHPGLFIARVAPETRRITELRAVESTRIPLRSPCERTLIEGAFKGVGDMTVLGGTAQLDIRLADCSTASAAVARETSVAAARAEAGAVVAVAVRSSAVLLRFVERSMVAVSAALADAASRA